jgi:hypothetical protein
MHEPIYFLSFILLAKERAEGGGTLFLMCEKVNIGS